MCGSRLKNGYQPGDSKALGENGQSVLFTHEPAVEKRKPRQRHKKNERRRWRWETLRKWLLFARAMFRNPVVRLLQVLFCSEEEDNLHLTVRGKDSCLNLFPRSEVIWIPLILLEAPI